MGAKAHVGQQDVAARVAIGGDASPSSSSHALHRLLHIAVLVRLALVGLMLATHVIMLPGTSERSDAAAASASFPSTSSLDLDPSSLPDTYDASAGLYVLRAWREQCPHASPITRRITAALATTAHWDGLHFLDIANDGSYPLEKESAFFPGWPWFIRAGARLVQTGQNVVYNTHLLRVSDGDEYKLNVATSVC